MHGFAQVSARLRLVERGAARTGAKSGVAERNSGTWRMGCDRLQAVSGKRPLLLRSDASSSDTQGESRVR